MHIAFRVILAVESDIECSIMQVSKGIASYLVFLSKHRFVSITRGGHRA